MQSSAARWQPFPDLHWVKGGFSERADGGMSWYGMDPRETVRNRTAFFAKYGLDVRNGISADQVHGARLHVAGILDAGRGIDDPATRIPETDGFVSDQNGIVLTTLHADCAPVFYADTQHKVIALIHAGWRGIAGGLPGIAVQFLHEHFGSKPSGIRVAVGPMICPRHYNVGPDVEKRFREIYGNGPIIHEGEQTKLDLFAALTMGLQQHGISADQLPARPPCTAEGAQFWSFRRDGMASRSMMAWLTIR